MPQKIFPVELKTIHNKDFFYIKASATEKIKHLLSDVRDEIRSVIEKKKIVFLKNVDSTMGKIFRGENYLELPYLVLDYPKHFSNNSVFAFRTMFWWGNFFSCTLHLQGTALNHYRKNLVSNLNKLKKKNIFICVNDNPWQYHYEKDNYLPIDKIPANELLLLIKTKHFLKFSKKIPLKDYEKVASFSKDFFETMIEETGI